VELGGCESDAVSPLSDKDLRQSADPRAAIGAAIFPQTDSESGTKGPGRPGSLTTQYMPADGPQQDLVEGGDDLVPPELIDLWRTLDQQQRQALIDGLRRLAGRAD